MAAEKLYELWAKRNPKWEKRYEDKIIKTLTDYSKGQTSLRDERGKILGAGYEIYIIAFFLGLYNNQRRKLNEDSTKCKDFGHAIENWGNINVVGKRHQYPKLREFIFTALVARTDIDYIALDKGEISVRKAVDALIQTMEEYANWGFYFMEDKLIEDSSYFFKQTAFLEEFLLLGNNCTEYTNIDEPESLD